MPTQRFILCFWIGIFVVAAFFRFFALTERPLHADEATGARLLSQRLETKTYEFNPKHFHGPLLSLSSVPLAHLRGESTWSDLSEYTLRFMQAAAGLLIVAIPLFHRSRYDIKQATVAAAFLATSPLLVYYSRMYIHESWLTLFAIAGCLSFICLLEKPSLLRAVMTGLFVGLMFATKETFVITIASWCVAGVCFMLCRRKGLSDLKAHLAHGVIAAVVAVFIATLFYTEGFRSPSGIINAVKTYFVYETTPGHEKHWAYYLEFLIEPKHAFGIYWTELSILAFAIIACIRSRHSATVVFLATAIIVQLILYSSIAYKTPWLMLVTWAHTCLLAGYAFNTNSLPRSIYNQGLYLLLALCLCYQTYQTYVANLRFANDTRNPYAYVPTSKDMKTLETWLHTLNEVEPHFYQKPVAIVGSEIWPLPWYLRKFETLGHWMTPPDEIANAPIVFAMPDQTEAVNHLLNETHTTLPRSLRTNVSIALYLENDIWDSWIEASEK